MPAPALTSGHHFSDLLLCPQRAWLHYHADPRLQVIDPPYLRALQAEGVAHEREVYTAQFPAAVRIPELADRAERYRRTVEAMRTGAPAILQAYLLGQDGVGVADVLELVGPNPASATGHDYRIGEVKRSPVLRTAHVLQAAWYANLLREQLGQHCWEAFFILGDGHRQTVDLSPVHPEYLATKEALLSLREGTTPEPGPHLSRPCPSCHWRGVCMPRLVTEAHLSLVPGIGRQGAETLKAGGIATWRDMPAVRDAALEDTGLQEHEIVQAKRAVPCLESGLPPLRVALDPGALRGLCAVSLEFPELAEERRAGQSPTPSAIYYDTGTGVQGVPLDSHIDDLLWAPLQALPQGRSFVLYGDTDRHAFLELARGPGRSRRPKAIDLLWLVETFVHSPVLGLDLGSVAALAGAGTPPFEPLSGPERAQAIRAVVNWIWRAACQT